MDGEGPVLSPTGGTRCPRLPLPHLPAYDVGRSLSTDYFGLKDQLSEDDFALLLKARDFVEEEVLPVISGYWERAELPLDPCSAWASWGWLATGSRATAVRT